MTRVTFTVNGRAVEADVAPRTHLADYLRESLHLTGTHLGCEHGVCGACTLMVDGEPVRGCITFAAACDGAQVRTVEGFAGDALMAALRDAFSRHHALQCGYCTPGMLITAYDVVCRLPAADEARVREELGGNLCRCTGYAGIVAAIREVSAAAPLNLTVPLPARTIEIVAAREFAPEREAGEPIAVSVTAERGNDGRLARHVELAIAADDLWAIVHDPRAVVPCLPGATLESVDDDGTLHIRLMARIGPVRAVFDGAAQVRYDEAAREGTLAGSGHDRLTRSDAEGDVRFAVAGDGAGSRLTVSIDYALKGMLAQIGRGAVVNAVVDRLLTRFAENIVARASGVAEVPPDAAGGGALWQRIKRALFD